MCIRVFNTSGLFSAYRSASPEVSVRSKIRTRSLALLLFLPALLLVLSISGSPVKGDADNATSTLPDIQPAQGAADPGPTTLYGVEKGTPQFLSSDIYVSGSGDYRLYFDVADKTNYHFFEKQGRNVSIGLCEAGIEQIFNTGTLAGDGGLRLARHASHIALFQESLLVACAFDDRRIGGTIGYRMISDGPPVTLNVEPCEDIHFADDFMISENKTAFWRGNGSTEAGDFSVKSLRHPLLSANAFNYMGAGKNIYSVVGHPWWDNYVFDSAIRGPNGQWIGLVFAFQDDKNYGLFRWSSRKDDDAGTREMVLIRNGEEKVLARQTGGYAPDQWYAASVRLTYANVTVSIDGTTLMDVSHPALACGGAGVWCDVARPATLAADPKAQSFQVNSLNELMKQHAAIDDVRINTLEGVQDDFRSAGKLGGGWLIGSGKWQISADGTKPGELNIVAAGAPAKALIGDRRWAQYVLETDVKSGSAAAGVIFLHRDESNYYSATIDSENLTLTHVNDGQPATVVDHAPLSVKTRYMRLKTTIQRGHIRVQAIPLNEQGAPDASFGASVEAFEGETALKGRVGLISSNSTDGADGSSFRRFYLSFLPEPEPLVTSNAIFDGETTMSEWTAASSEWYKPKEQMLVSDKAANVLWHRGQFPGDVELSIEPREITEAKYEVALSLSKDGQGKDNGYVFRYKGGDSAEGPSRTAHLSIKRQGKLVMEKPLTEDTKQPTSVSFRRCGKYVVGVVNGRPVIHFRDEQPLAGNRVAFYTLGMQVRMEAIKIISDRFKNELFSRACIGWRTAGNAIAEVTNRWQCDPRWSFFSLKNDRKAGKPAVLWSKYLYPGDVTIEFYAGNKMEGERGAPYTYARDFNVTICSDGSDLTKGYTFMWGGQGNQGTMILRDGVEVKRCNVTIPTDMNFHRHWFSIKVEKKGKIVTFRVDRMFVKDNPDTGEMVFEDTQPLTGDHIAIWTYDHAIMLSRVRISGEGGEQMDAPDWKPGTLKTPYDNK
jgi:hypothetical protein